MNETKPSSGPTPIGKLMEQGPLETLIAGASNRIRPSSGPTDESEGCLTVKSSELIEWELKAPFHPGMVKARQGPGGKTLHYVDARAVMIKLDEVVGPAGWQSRMVAIGGEVACELSIKFGDEWITKTDGAGETSIEGEKGQFSDAFKRAAVLFGAGRYLYRDGLHSLTMEQYVAKVPKPV